MPATTLRIATRNSPLALWQAEHVRARLLALHPGLEVKLVGIQTRGDKVLDSPLAKIGGKGLFIKELEQSLADGATDIAVHSMKDVTIDLPPGMALPVVLEREDPRDAFVSNHHADLESLPQYARVGTSSLRRQCQLKALRPDLEILNLRGNVGTRLRRLDEDRYDAIILAAAGLIRLDLAQRIRQFLPVDCMLPAIGQGAIGIECRDDDAVTRALIAPLDHPDTHICVAAERAVNRRLFGGCQVPVAGHARLEGAQRETMHLRALVGRTDGSELLQGVRDGRPGQAEEIGADLAEELLAKGARAILAELSA